MEGGGWGMGPWGLNVQDERVGLQCAVCREGGGWGGGGVSGVEREFGVGGWFTRVDMWTTYGANY